MLNGINLTMDGIKVVSIVNKEENNILNLYSGFNCVVERPYLRKEKWAFNNDYGSGLYCTEDKDLSDFWAIKYDSNGQGVGKTNHYQLDVSDLEVKNLDNNNPLEWLSVLMTFREINYSYLDNNEINVNGISVKELEARRIKFLEMFNPKNSILEGYDVVNGYRIDSSYSLIAVAFLCGVLSVKQLKECLHLGNLGYQVVLISDKAFLNLSYIEATPASWGDFKPNDYGDYLVGKKEELQEAITTNVRSGGSCRKSLFDDIAIDYEPSTDERTIVDILGGVDNE